MNIVEKLRGILRRHPVVRDVLRWTVPALIFGAALRALLLSYSPYVYWGADSKSYFSFAGEFLTRGILHFDAKRRYIYPALMLPVALLPGSPLKWLAWLQPALGLASLLPLGYVVRKSFVHWRWLILPVTIFYAGNPIIFWYEHELLGDTLFFDAIVWMLAGWAAWTGELNRARAARLWWWFFVPLAILVLTKPSARFFAPGILLGLLAVYAWRVLRWPHAVALVALILTATTVGDEEQGNWLLYTSVFPLTRMDTPLHAEYKAEIRDIVEETKANLDFYYRKDAIAFKFLRTPRDQTNRPLWQELGRDEKKLSRVCRDLAVEAIKARPDLFLYISLQRIVASANPEDFKTSRFEADYFGRRFEELYREFAVRKPDLPRILFALPREEPLPPYETIRARIAPQPDALTADLLQSYVATFRRVMQIAAPPSAVPKSGRKLTGFRPTLLGWWLIVGALLSLLPHYRRNPGIWVIAMTGYLWGVFLVGIASARYFAPAWPLIALVLAIPADVLLRVLHRAFHSSDPPRSRAL